MEQQYYELYKSIIIIWVGIVAFYMLQLIKVENINYP